MVKKKFKPCPGQTSFLDILPAHDVVVDEAPDMLDSSQWSGILTGALIMNGPKFRYFTIYPDQWWTVLGEYAKPFGYRDAANAARQIHSKYVKRVDEVFPQGTHLMSTLQLQPHQQLVSRHGAYQLIIRSNHPQAELATEYLFDLIDQAFGVGGKTLMSPAARREKERLGLTDASAIERSNLRTVNRDFVNNAHMNHVHFYNGRWVGLTEGTSGYWRRQVGDDPLDRCSELLSTLHNTATCIVMANVKLAKERGEPIDEKDYPRLIHEVAMGLRGECLDAVGPGHEFGVDQEKRKGRLVKIVGLVRKELEIPVAS